MEQNTSAAAVDELLDILALQRVGDDSFTGRSVRHGLGNIFGGQLTAQALSAAQQTVVASKRAHSLHLSFLRSGALAEPLVLTVDRIRDARAFSTRRVTIEQNGDTLCIAMASFHIEEAGFEHQRSDAPPTPSPESLTSERQIYGRFLETLPDQVRAAIPSELIERVCGARAFELRPIDHFSDPLRPARQSPAQDIWFRTSESLPQDALVHQRLLAFASDFHFLGTAMRPHGLTVVTPGVVVASLNHAMWFHRPHRCDQWLLHSMESPTAQGARGLARGQWFSADGLLVASTSQEGLIRNRFSAPAPRPSSSA